MRRAPAAALVAALTGLPLITPVPRVAAEPPMCTPSRPGHDGCIPSPLDCATGRFNGVWKAPADGRRATCDGSVDEAGRPHIRRYSGGDPSVGCNTTIRDDKLLEGSWTDPNQMCGAYGIDPGYGVAGSRYEDAVTSRFGAVASSSPDASAAGIGVLAEGGNAVDAAVATVMAVGVVAQESCGIGGGGFLLYRGADGTAAVLDFRETAPARLAPGFEATPRRFAGTGHQVVGVPGTVAGVAEAVERYGSWPLGRLLGPAVALAERGVRLTPFQTEACTSEKDRLNSYDGSRALYLDGGEVPAPWPLGGQRVQSDLARTLRTLADEGPSAFYRGSIAEAISAEMERSRAPGRPGARAPGRPGPRTARRAS